MRKVEMRPPPVVLMPLKCDECPGIATVTTGNGDKLCYDCGKDALRRAARARPALVRSNGREH